MAYTPQTLGVNTDSTQDDNGTGEKSEHFVVELKCQEPERQISNAENQETLESKPTMKDQKTHEKCNESESPWNEKKAKNFKLSLHIINGLVVFMSLAVVICASYNLSVLKSFEEVSRGRNKVSDIVLIIGVLAGGSLAVYGSTSAAKKKRQGLHVEAGGLLVLTIVLVSLSTVMIVQRPSEDSILKDRLAESFAKAPGSSVDRDVWDKIERQFKCCGNLGPRDYSLPMTPPHIPPEVSLSCCTNARNNASYVENHRARRTCIQQKLFYQNGCQSLVAELFAQSSIAVMVSVFILANLQLLASFVCAGLSRFVKCVPAKKPEMVEIDVVQCEISNISHKKSTE